MLNLDNAERGAVAGGFYGLTPASKQLLKGLAVLHLAETTRLENRDGRPATFADCTFAPTKVLIRPGRVKYTVSRIDLPPAAPKGFVRRLLEHFRRR